MKILRGSILQQQTSWRFRQNCVYPEGFGSGSRLIPDLEEIGESPRENPVFIEVVNVGQCLERWPDDRLPFQ